MVMVTLSFVETSCYSRAAIDRIWHGSGPTFEIIQFSNLNLGRHGN